MWIKFHGWLIRGPMQRNDKGKKKKNRYDEKNSTKEGDLNPRTPMVLAARQPL